MSVWILVIAIHVGVSGDGNSNSITTVSGFKTEASCLSAAKKADKLMYGTVKEVRTTCLEAK